nr:hypothetical protein Iba_contig432CG0040 [Ipomoea batatas]
MVPMKDPNRRPADMVNGMAVLSFSSLGPKFKSLLKLWGAPEGVLERVCCFLVCLREERGFNKWNRLGLKLYRNEEQEGEENEERAKHSDNGRVEETVGISSGGRG